MSRERNLILLLIPSNIILKVSFFLNNSGAVLTHISSWLLLLSLYAFLQQSKHFKHVIVKFSLALFRLILSNLFCLLLILSSLFKI